MNMLQAARTVFVDPPYAAYYQNRFFDLSNANLNRDGTLVPYARARENAFRRGVEVLTADALLENPALGHGARYFSFGLLDHFQTLADLPDLRLKAFVLFEPPVVAPKLYRALPKLTEYFEQVYIHNTVGDGYSLRGVDQSRLKQLWWPQPFDDVLPEHWNRVDRANRIVVINGNHIPRRLNRQLYSRRISAMAELAKFGIVDLYGMGWNKWWSHRSMWPPYWFNYGTLMSIYRGSCGSKFETLSQYRFSLCFENMAMQGYLTEKIFDCLYSGTVPLYLGAPDIDALVPKEAFVDCRKFSSWSALWESVRDMPDSQWQAMRAAGRDFLRSEAGRRYYTSLDVMLGID